MNTQEVVSELSRIIVLAEALREKLGGVAIAPNAPDEVARRISSGLCLVCGRPLKDKKSVRGNHEYCRGLVEERYSDEDAVKNGLLLPSKKGGRKRVIGQMLDDLEAAKKLSRQRKKQP